LAPVPHDSTGLDGHTRLFSDWAFRLVNLGGKTVIRNLGFAVFLLLLIAGASPGQEWAKKLFSDFDHDFGTVARGAKEEYRFEMVNCYVEDVHIRSVRTSCGCTTPRIEKETLKTWEKGAIIAKLNTGAFMGYKNASIIVTIDQPYFAEVHLNIRSRIRSDVVFTPGVVQLGSVDQGTKSEQTISVDYAGRSDWQLVDIRSANQSFEVELTETRRSAGRVSYDMTVRLRGDAPPGYINDQLTLVTNDNGTRTIPLSVEGRVISSLTVSPAALSLGTVEPGEKVTKQLIVRAKKPFKILDVRCSGGDDCFEFKKPADTKTLQLIPVTFTAGTTPGKVVQTIEIQTDMGASKATCVATAFVKVPDGG
jgi:hypothetical protein